MLLFTGAALVVALVIIGIALIQQKPPTTSELFTPNSEVPAGLADGRTLGTVNAPVTIQVWSDFQCPACRSFATDVESSVIQQFVVPGTVKLVYSDAAWQGQRGPDPSWDESVEAAAGARCAADQGMFWQMHDWLYANWEGENVGSFSASRLRAIATAASLDMTNWDACMSAGDKQAAVRSETANAGATGISQTPTLVINGTNYVGVPAYSALVAVIQQAASSAQ